MRQPERFQKNGLRRLVTASEDKKNETGAFLPGTPPLIGVLEGSGIGAEIIGSALQVLQAVAQVLHLEFAIRRGGLIGEPAIAAHGQWLPEETAEFCADIFNDGGAILNGPGGGRYVYDLRRRFDLSWQIVPVRPGSELARRWRKRLAILPGVDMLIVRDNAGGVYQGSWGERVSDQGRVAEHSFLQRAIHRLASRRAALRSARRGARVNVKDGGVPTISGAMSSALPAKMV